MFLQPLRGGLLANFKRHFLMGHGDFDRVISILQRMQGNKPKRAVPKREINTVAEIEEYQKAELLQQLSTYRMGLGSADPN